MALAPPLWFACDSKNMFLGQTEQQQELYQALTSAYWYPLLKMSGGTGDSPPSTSSHLRKHSPAQEQSSPSHCFQPTVMFLTPYVPYQLIFSVLLFLQGLLPSLSSAVAFSLPMPELSSPSWPPARPSCFPDPIFRQG